jgi:hypothetical protein
MSFSRCRFAVAASALAVVVLATSPVIAQECVALDVACGDTVSATIDEESCSLSDPPTLFDLYEFDGLSGQMVDVRVDAGDGLTPSVALFDPVGNLVAEGESEVQGGSARLVFVLDETGDWGLSVSGESGANETGTYTLTFACDEAPAPEPPYDTWLRTPELAGFEFQVRISAAGESREGDLDLDCQSETLCVAGAVSGRSEVYVRVVGPKPNGRLWPEVIKFSTSRVEAWIRQISSGEVIYFDLDGLGPGDEELDGRVERQGFVP